MNLTPADIDDPRVAGLLAVHFATMRSITPIESCHVLDLAEMRSPQLSCWAAWDGVELLGVGALLALDPGHGEIKSMHTAEAARGRGVGTAILRHIMDAARERGMSRLSLETGASEPFRPARALYARHGFAPCPPFGSYAPDPNSVFMTRQI